MKQKDCNITTNLSNYWPTPKRPAHAHAHACLGEDERRTSAVYNGRRSLKLSGGV